MLDLFAAPLAAAIVRLDFRVGHHGNGVTLLGTLAGRFKVGLCATQACERSVRVDHIGARGTSLSGGEVGQRHVSGYSLDIKNGLLDWLLAG